MRARFSSLILIVSLALGIVAGAQIILTKATPDFEKEVTYTASGFTPAVLEVQLGEQVSFKNVSQIALWTGSDPHPTHSDYPEFDAKRDFAPGESYVFQFTRTGTFGYHNHEKSNHRGIIRVSDHEHPSANIDKTKQSARDVRDNYMVMLKQDDPNSIFTMIDAIAADPVLSKDCHDISHDLGHHAYELFGFSGAMTYNNPGRLSHTSVDDICAGGYMHGILEEVFLNRPELKDNPGSICDAIPAINRGSCFHGVGHGLMFVNKRDVPASLAACRALSKSIDKNRCYEGVWMEMFWGNIEHAGANSLGWTLERPLAACVNAQSDEKYACYLYAHLGFLRTHPHFYDGVVTLCTKSGLVESDEGYCLKGIGITMMKHFTSHHLELTESLVKGLSTSEKRAYYEGVIGYARLSAVSDGYLTHFCNILKTDTSVCLNVMETSPR